MTTENRNPRGPSQQKLKPKKRNYVPLPLITEQTVSEVYYKYYHIKFETKEEKRSINPYDLQNEIKTHTGLHAKSITTFGALSFNIEVQNQNQGSKLLKLNKFKDTKFTVEPNNRLNHCKGLVYINEFDFEEDEDVSSFTKELCKIYKLQSAIQATFIKPRRQQTKAFLLEFKQEIPPTSIYIPGERTDTTVYPYMDRPLHCSKCQLYGHSKNRCSKDIQCARCGTEHHGADQCQANEPKCFHCSGAQYTKNKTCPRQQMEQNLVNIMNKEKVTIRRARQILDCEEERSIEAPPIRTNLFKCSMAENKK